MKGRSAISLLVAIFSSTCYAQNNCSELLRHGLYDTLRSGNASASAASIRNKICTANSAQNNSSNGGNAGLNVTGYGSGNASWNQAQSAAAASSMCSASSSDQSAQQNLDIYSQILDPGAVSAFQDCVRLQSAGIHFNLQIDENIPDSLAIAVNQTISGGTKGDAVILGVQIDMPNDTATERQVTCEGPLWHSKNAALTNDWAGMTCKRPIVADVHKAFYVAGRLVLAAPARITILTNAGNVSTQLQAIPAPEIAIESPIPIGAIIDWYGSAATPSLPDNFILCDGRPIPSGPLVGQRTPNLIGRVTMGSNQVGAIGGAASATIVIPAHSHKLIIGQPENALQVQGGNGVILHTTSADFLVNSITDEVPETSQVVSTLPPYFGTYKVMRYK